MGKISLHDTCGVNNLHGMPAILAAVVSIVTTAINRDNTGLDNYGAKYGDVGDSPRYLMQLYSLLCTLGIALVGGAVTGMILRIPAIEHLTEYEYLKTASTGRSKRRKTKNKYNKYPSYCGS